MRFLALLIRFLFVTTHRDVESRRKLLLQLACSVVLSRESADARFAGVMRVSEVDFLRIVHMMSDMHGSLLFNMEPGAPTQPWIDRQIALRVQDNLQFDMNAKVAFRDAIASSSLFEGVEYEHFMDHSELHHAEQVELIRQCLDLETEPSQANDVVETKVGVLPLSRSRTQSSSNSVTEPRAKNSDVRSDKGSQHHCSCCGVAGHKSPTCPERVQE